MKALADIDRRRRSGRSVRRAGGVELSKVCPRLLRLISREEERAAAKALGHDEELVRLFARRQIRIEQLAITSVPLALGLFGTVLGRESAPFVLSAAGLVALTLIASTLVTNLQLRNRAQELIATGYGEIGVRLVTDERRRLLSRKSRERLARSLERLLDDAQNWGKLLPASRPPAGVRALRYAPDEVREIATLLRADPVRVPGVARTTRLLSDGVDSPLYRGDVEDLRAELRRIRDLLALEHRAEDTREERVAA